MRVVATLALAGAVVAGVAWGFSPVEREGQIVFVPTDRSSVVPAGSTSQVTIESCKVADDGLRVRGRVDSPSASVTVAVTDADPTRSGIRVGRAFAANAGLIPEATSGDFDVLLRWADESAEFVVVGMEGDRVLAESPIATCPSTSNG